MSAAILPVSLELLVVGDGEADEVGLEGLGGVLDLLDGRLHGRELYQCEQGVDEGFIILVEGIDFVVVLKEAENIHADDAVDEESDGQDHEEVEGPGQDGEDGVEDFVGEGDLVED